jgi:hypothetical protein
MCRAATSTHEPDQTRKRSGTGSGGVTREISDFQVASLRGTYVGSVTLGGLACRRYCRSRCMARHKQGPSVKPSPFGDMHRTQCKLSTEARARACWNLRLSGFRGGGGPESVLRLAERCGDPGQGPGATVCTALTFEPGDGAHAYLGLVGELCLRKADLAA